MVMSMNGAGQADQTIMKPRQKSQRRGCISCCVVSVVFFFILVSVVFLLLFLGYDLWFTENRDLLNSFSPDEKSRLIARDDLNYNLERFKNSDIQKETIWLSCDQANLVFEDIVKENWNNFGVKNVGVVCDDRSLIVYLEVRSSMWFTVKVWQRAEGSVDFMVYDVMVGPYSLANLTFGYVSEEFSSGVGDAQDLVSRGSFSGRNIEEIYIEDDGVRIIGTLDDGSE